MTQYQDATHVMIHQHVPHAWTSTFWIYWLTNATNAPNNSLAVNYVILRQFAFHVRTHISYKLTINVIFVATTYLDVFTAKLTPYAHNVRPHTTWPQDSYATCVNHRSKAASLATTRHIVSNVGPVITSTPATTSATNASNPAVKCAPRIQQTAALPVTVNSTTAGPPVLPAEAESRTVNIAIRPSVSPAKSVTMLHPFLAAWCVRRLWLGAADVRMRLPVWSAWVRTLLIRRMSANHVILLYLDVRIVSISHLASRVLRISFLTRLAVCVSRVPIFKDAFCAEISHLVCSVDKNTSLARQLINAHFVVNL